MAPKIPDTYLLLSKCHYFNEIRGVVDRPKRLEQAPKPTARWPRRYEWLREKRGAVLEGF
jgi:hypothetical protein